MAAPASTPTYVIDADYHTSGRVASVAIVRLYDPTGVAMKVFVAEDAQDHEDWTLTTLSTVFSRTIRRISGWDTRRVVMPQLLRRCFRRSIPFPWYYHDRFGPRYRYSDTENLDLREFFSDYGMIHDVTSLRDAFSLVGSLSEYDLRFSPARVLASSILAARADFVTGRATEEMHTRTIGNLHGAMATSLELRPTTDQKEDVLGVELGSYWDAKVGPAYSAILSGFQ